MPFPLSVVCWRSLVRASITGASVQRHSANKKMNDSRSLFGLLTARPMVQRVYKLSWPPKDFTPSGTGLGDCVVKWGCLANKSANSRRQPILLILCLWRRISLVRSLRRRSPTKSGPVISPISLPTKAGFIWLVSRMCLPVR